MRQGFQLALAFRVAGVEQGVLPLTEGVAGALTHHAEQLAKVTAALGQLLTQLRQLLALRLEARIQLVGTRLRTCQLGTRLGEARLLLVALTQEGLLALTHGGLLGAAGFADLLQQSLLVEGLRLHQGRQTTKHQHPGKSFHWDTSALTAGMGKRSNCGDCSLRAMAMPSLRARR